MTKIRYFAFGGTIASVPTDPSGHVAPQLTGMQLLEGLPGLPPDIGIEVVECPSVVSFAMTIAQLLDLAESVSNAARDGVDGVVISHGTDTMEETAYALALMVPRTLPVVLTGAVRNPSLPSSDGHANLLTTFRVAADARVASFGPLVVMEDELHAARFVTKGHTSRPSAFVSPGAGPVGEITEGRVDIWWRPAWEDYLGLPNMNDVGNVELLKMTVDPSDSLLRAAIAAGPTGIVIEGVGGGHVPPTLLPVIETALKSGFPVVVSTRATSGATLEQTYGVPGAEVDLIARGALRAGRLSSVKARLRLLIGSALHLDARHLFPVR